MDPIAFEIQQLRGFLEPLLRRRGWVNSSEADDEEFKRRLTMFFETGLNVRQEVLSTYRGDSVAILTVHDGQGQNGSSAIQFHGLGRSPVLAFFRAAEKLVRDERYSEELNV